MGFQRLVWSVVEATDITRLQSNVLKYLQFPLQTTNSHHGHGDPADYLLSSCDEFLCICTCVSLCVSVHMYVCVKCMCVNLGVLKVDSLETEEEKVGGKKGGGEGVK